MLKRKARSVFTQISTDLSPVYFVVFIKKALLEAGVDTIAEEYKKIFSK